MSKIVLVITSSVDETSNYIIKKYKNISFFRLNVDNFEKYDFEVTEHGWKILTDNNVCTNRDICSIYYRKPILPKIEGYSSEYICVAQKDIITFINGLVDSFEGIVLSKPYLLRKTENKVFQLLIAKKFGFYLPRSCITNNIYFLDEFFHSKSIIKPISIGKVNLADKCNLHNTAMLKKFSSDICVTPVYVQKYIKKKYEVRITIVGRMCFAVSIYSANKVDWRIDSYENKYLEIECPDDIRNKCIDILIKNNLFFGAFDFIVDPLDNWFFLEFNPNGQWLWLEKILGINISKYIVGRLLGSR